MIAAAFSEFGSEVGIRSRGMARDVRPYSGQFSGDKIAQGREETGGVKCPD